MVISRGTRDRMRKATRLTLSYGILVLITVVILIPVIWFLLDSVKRDIELKRWPIRVFAEEAQWNNYVMVFTTGGFSFLEYAGRTAVLAIVSTLLHVTTCAMGGYAFARLKGVPGRKTLYWIVIALLVIPGGVFLIPRYIWYYLLGMVRTYWPWVLEGAAGSAFYIFMFRQFFASFPDELEDAAEMDGCGPSSTFWMIHLPNTKPVLATASIFLLQDTWGEYVRPLLYLTDEMTTLGVKLRTSYVDFKGFPLQTVTMAANVVFVLPVIVLFFVGQKYILKGMVRSGLQGI